MPILYFMIVLAVNASESVGSAQTLNLQTAVTEGLSRSPVVQKAESKVRENKWQKREAFSHFLPSISASAIYLTNERDVQTDINFGGSPVSVPQILPKSNFVISAQLPIFEGGAGTKRYLGQVALAASASDEFLWTQFKVAREIMLQYDRSLAAIILKDVAAQNVNALEDHLREVKLFKKAGIATNFDVLKVEVQASEAHSELLSKEDDVIIQHHKLNEIMGIENDAREITGELPILSEELIKGKNLTVTATRHDLSALSHRAEAMRDFDSAASRYWSPRIGFFGQYQYYNNRSDSLDARDEYRDAYQAGLQLTWNLFDGMSSISKSHVAAEQAYQAERSLRQAQLHSNQDIELWRRKFIYNCNVFRSRQDEVKKATESVRLAAQGRKVGTRTNTDLLDAENELYRAKAGLVNAQLGSVEALINLELATGEEIYNFIK